MKRYNDYGNPVRTSENYSIQALIDYCDDLAEAVERLEEVCTVNFKAQETFINSQQNRLKELEKKVEFILENTKSHNRAYYFENVESLKDLYQSTQDHE